MNRDDRAALRALLAAATPGPMVSATGRTHYEVRTRGGCREDGQGVGELLAGRICRSEDSRLIAAAVNALPALLDAADERDRLRVLLDEAAKELRDYFFLAHQGDARPLGGLLERIDLALRSPGTGDGGGA
jgi:hypothetical protein